MSDPTFMADPTRLVIAAIVGIALLLALIIKFKLHPVLSMMVSALAIGIGAGMPLDLVADTVTKGVGTTLQNIALLIGLGSMFGQILEESGGAKKIAQTFIDTFGQGHSSWALGITGLVIGTTVFFEAGVVVLIPLAFSVASQTKKSTLYYGIALLAGLAAGYAFVPPSAGSVLVAGTLGVDLGTISSSVSPAPSSPWRLPASSGAATWAVAFLPMFRSTLPLPRVRATKRSFPPLAWCLPSCSRRFV